MVGEEQGGEHHLACPGRISSKAGPARRWAATAVDGSVVSDQPWAWGLILARPPLVINTVSTHWQLGRANRHGPRSLFERDLRIVRFLSRGCHDVIRPIEYCFYPFEIEVNIVTKRARWSSHWWNHLLAEKPLLSWGLMSAAQPPRQSLTSSLTVGICWNCSWIATSLRMQNALSRRR